MYAAVPILVVMSTVVLSPYVCAQKIMRMELESN